MFISSQWSQCCSPRIIFTFLLNGLSVALQGLYLPLYRQSSWHTTTPTSYRNMYSQATTRFYYILVSNAFSMARVLSCLVWALLEMYEFTDLQHFFFIFINQLVLLLKKIASSPQNITFTSVKTKQEKKNNGGLYCLQSYAYAGIKQHAQICRWT